MRAIRSHGITGGGRFSAELSPQAWLAGGTVLFSGRSGDSTNIWQIRVEPATGRVSGSPQQSTFGTGPDVQPSVTRNGRMVFTSGAENWDVWSLGIDGNQGKALGEPIRQTQDVAREMQPSLSDNGKTLVFRSRRSGNWDLWMKRFRKRKTCPSYGHA